MPITAYEKKKSALYKQYFKARTSHAKLLKKALKSGKFGAELKARHKMDNLVHQLNSLTVKILIARRKK
jgi:hypothetical protein